LSKFSAASLVTFGIALVGAWLWFRYAPPFPPDENRPAETPSILAEGSPSDFFVSQSIGEAPRGSERPLISHVEMDDLDRDGLVDVLVCDVVRHRVSWIRQFPKGTFTEIPVGDSVSAPAHVEPVDLDGDGDRDLIVASLSVLFPNNNRIGAVVALENDGRQRFTNHVLVDRVARVADARAGDLDGDGDLDLAVAGFGYDSGETAWLENRGPWKFQYHILQRLSGPVNTLVSDLDRDGRVDITSLVSQEWEEVWAFHNDGPGRFTPKLLWGSTNADFGSSWITLVDLDRDGDPDFLYSNGDAFDYAPANSRPWHGVQWLENRGDLRFEFHRIAELSGASSPQAADIDADGDLDVVVSSAHNNWDDPMARSLVWLENNGRMQFALHEIARVPTHLITLAAGDLDGDRRPDLVTGGMHISRPYDRMSRVMLWRNVGQTPR
jgi:hypothetical protein